MRNKLWFSPIFPDIEKNSHQILLREKKLITEKVVGEFAKEKSKFARLGDKIKNK